MTIHEAESRMRRPVAVREQPVRSAFRSVRAAPTRSEPRGVIEVAVDTAYRVFEEYVTLGEQFAARRTPAQEKTMQRTPYSFDDQNLAAQLLSGWQELYKQWWVAFAPLFASMPGFANLGNLAPTASAHAGLDLKVVVSRPARIQLHFTRVPANAKLHASLNGQRGEGPLSFSFTPSAIELAPASHVRAGTYDGVVRDDNGAMVGAMTLVLEGDDYE